MSWLTGLLARLVGMAVAAFGWYSAGRASARAAAAERSLDRAREANEIDEEVGALSDADLADRLRKYQRH